MHLMRKATGHRLVIYSGINGWGMGGYAKPSIICNFDSALKQPLIRTLSRPPPPTSWDLALTTQFPVSFCAVVLNSQPFLLPGAFWAYPIWLGAFLPKIHPLFSSPAQVPGLA